MSVEPITDKTESTSKQWYVLHVHSGFEKSVKQTLETRIGELEHSDRMEDFPVKGKLGRVLMPVEEVVEMKDGHKSISQRKFYPGYILVEMEMDDTTWHWIRKFKRVSGFVGGAKDGHNPVPISQADVDKIMLQMSEGAEKPRPKVLFDVGQTVRIKEGPFTDFNGMVEEVNYEKNKLRISVTIFGRATPVEMDFDQVEKE